MSPLLDLDERTKKLTGEVVEKRRLVDGRSAQLAMLMEQHQALEVSLAQLDLEIQAATEARALLETITDAKRELVRNKIEALVTMGIQAVFGPSYEFRIEQGTARGLVTFEYKILHDFDGVQHVSDLRGYHGGGLVALVGFLLRVVMVLFVRPAKRRLIVLDETMAALDGDKRAPFSSLLNSLATQLDMQFVLVTHSPEFATDADKAYQIRMDKPGISVLEPI